MTNMRFAWIKRGFFTYRMCPEKVKGFQEDEIKNHDSESGDRIIQGVFGIYTMNDQGALSADKAENHQYYKRMQRSCIVCGVLEAVGNLLCRTSLEKIFEAGRRGAASAGDFDLSSTATHCFLAKV